MADAGLKIVIGADLSSAITQVNQLTTGLNALGGAATGAAGVSKALDSISSSARSLGSLPASGEFVRSITAINPAALSAASGLKVLGASGTQLRGLGADANNAAKLLANIPAALRPVSSSGFSELTTGVRQFKREIEATQSSFRFFNTLPPALDETDDALKKIVPGANQANVALTNLGRIAQDAPFGFLGISNNINPLLESFQRLRASTGTTGGALKALGGSLLGGGGIGLAVSVVTGLLVVFGDKLFATKQKTDEAAESAKRYAEAQRDAVVSYQKQAIEVSSLVRIAQSDVSTKQEQANAIARINDLIPDNIGKLTALNIKTAEGINIIREYTKALEDQATAQLFINRAADIQGQKFDARAKFDKSQLDIVLRLKDAQKELAALPSARNAAPGLLEERARVADNIESLKREAKRNQDEFVADRIKFNESLKDIRSEIDKNLAGSLKVDVKIPAPPKTGAQDDALKDAITNLERLRDVVGLTQVETARLQDLRVQLVTRDQVKLGLNPEQLAREVSRIRSGVDEFEIQIKRLESLKKEVGLSQTEGAQLLNLRVRVTLINQAKDGLTNEQLQRQIDGIVGAAGLRVPLTIALDDDVEDKLRAKFGTLSIREVPLNVVVPNEDLARAVRQIDTTKALLDIDPTPIVINVDTDAANRKLAKLAQDINANLSQAIGSAFAGIGEVIGTALAGGDVQSIFGNFINILADGLKEIGKAMIAFGVAKEVLTKISKLNGFVAIAAGIGLVAAGAALQATVNKRRFAEGGIVTGPTNALIGEAGPEVVFPLSDLNSTLRRITGSNNQSQTYIPDVKLRGSDIVIAFNREKNRFGGSMS